MLVTFKEFFNNPEEFSVGAMFGIAPVFIIGWLAIPSAIICSLFWRLTGAGYSKLFRRLGVPLIIAIEMLVATHSPLALIATAMFGPLALGYGIPDATDKGSKLGAFFFRLVKGNEKMADFLTRLVIGFICALTILPMAFVMPYQTFIMMFILTAGFPALTLLV